MKNPSNRLSPSGSDPAASSTPARSTNVAKTGKAGSRGSSSGTPTMRELAALAGCSPTTISLALRNHPRIPASTRAHIQKFAVARGYRQDPVVATLMQQLRRSRPRRLVEKIAYFTAWGTREGWRKSEGESNYFLGACQRATTLGYEIEHVWVREPGLTTGRLDKILYTRAIRGIILRPFGNPRTHIKMEWKHFAVAAINNTHARPFMHRTSHGHYDGMFLALRHLRHQGYRRIGFATRLEQSRGVGDNWLAALLVHQRSIPAKQRIPPLLSPVPASVGMDAKAFRRWYRAHTPDVVISNLAAPLHLLREMDLRVPEDVGYASLDLIDKNDPGSGIDQQPLEIGASAVDLVVQQLQNNEAGLPTHPKTVYLEGHWRKGNTLLARHSATT